jgi:ABC-type transport system involved in cytochrome c biogenesis permease subunit
MAVKYTVQGLLIYIAIVAYLLALVTMLADRKRAGQTLFAAGFVVAGVSFVYRWFDVRHVPLQNLFEVFLFLGVVSYPISWFCRRVLRIGSQWADMLIGAVVLFPAGFVFNAQPMQLPPALQSWLFGPHVAVYMIAYLFMAKAAIQAAAQLRGARSDAEGVWLPPEQATYELIAIGFPLLTLGLVLGSWWGKLAWGHYWGWDPKELWSLASWLVYLGYFHWRYMFGKKYPAVNSLWAIAGMVAIIITLLWVNLSRLFPGLHSYAT